MEIKRNGSQPSVKGPAEWFTGVVRIDPLHQVILQGRGSVLNDQPVMPFSHFGADIAPLDYRC